MNDTHPSPAALAVVLLIGAVPSVWLFLLAWGLV